ncbi:hypothetical protein BJ165DRAFT_1423542 [Panaeolus papilionaceus]|nr:hypothetical protein BJ165DRAFT_1423542 [Panaeolus papilionaceus]
MSENQSISRGKLAQSSSSVNNPKGDTSINSARPASVHSTSPSKSSVNGSSDSQDVINSKSEQSEAPQVKVTKISSTTVSLPSTSWAPKPLSQKTPQKPAESAAAPEQQSTEASDPLQLASQLYPWMYMSSTLDACFTNVEEKANAELEAKEKELDVGEAETVEQRDRSNTERAIEFYDELGSERFAKEAPAVMKRFHSHGESCSRIEVDALKLANGGTPSSEDEEPLKPYHDILATLETLQKEATDLLGAIEKLTTSTQDTKTGEPVDEDTLIPGSVEDLSWGQSQVTGVLASCLPILRARISNLSMAQALTDSALENASLTLRLESMGL